MKSFPAAPWTLEDAMVWRRFELTIGDLAVWRYLHADRIDAALMLKWGQNIAGVSKELYAWWLILVGHGLPFGWNCDGSTTTDISNCA